MATRVMIVPPIYKQIISKFPQNITFSFAYGSAVKKQLENVNTNNMIDLIFCVNNPSAWHESNIHTNSSHYSGLKYFGHNFVSHYQVKYGAKVYFNTLVPMDGMYIKYGVISTKDLITDLLEWSDLYIAGRLHKPVEIIQKPLSSELETALQLNLKSAVHATLLILPENFTEYEFYHTLSNLSYSGDFRMTFGENKNKVENIVKPQVLNFRKLYQPLIKTLQDYVEIPIPNKDTTPEATKTDLKETEAKNSIKERLDVIKCRQDYSAVARLHHLNQLPRWPLKAITRFWNRDMSSSDSLNFDKSATRKLIEQENKEEYLEEKESHVTPFGPSLPPHLHKNTLIYNSEKYDQGNTKQHSQLGPKSCDRNEADMNSVIGPALPTHLNSKSNSPSAIIGPALPPNIQNTKSHLIASPREICIGPVLPENFKQKLAETTYQQSDEEDECIYGPIPIGATQSKVHLELEERALQMKIDLLNPINEKESAREEWMLELPAVKATHCGLGSRQFRAKQGPDMSDRSSWTDTPEDKKKRKENRNNELANIKREAEIIELNKRDKDQETISQKYKRNSESLMEIHTKKIKNTDDASVSIERRPFNREVDLQVNRFDEAQKKAILKKAQLLDKRFSSGDSKFL